MPTPERQREFARRVVAELRDAGHVAYWAGGCVRDQLRGVTPKDYDVATDATPDAIRGIFGHRRTIAVGAAFGVISVLGGQRFGSVEVATFRRDAPYSDGRHPDAVAFSSPEEDAQRRDFTINGLFYDPVDDRVIDFVDGQEDLGHGIVRAIGSPSDRIGEDKLRLLRAVRFAATLDFTIDPQTFAAVQQHAGEITVVSAERIGAEMERMLVDANRARAIELLAESLLLPHVLPEVRALKDAVGGAWRATLTVLETLDRPALPLALAALLHRVSGKLVAETVGRRLRFPNRVTDQAAWLLSHCSIIADAPAMPWPRLQRILIHDGADELLALRAAIAGPADAAVAFCREKLALPPDELNPEPLITGDDLIAHGIEPGKQFASLLTQVRDAQLDGKIGTKGEALQFVDAAAP